MISNRKSRFEKISSKNYLYGVFDENLKKKAGRLRVKGKKDEEQNGLSYLSIFASCSQVPCSFGKENNEGKKYQTLFKNRTVQSPI